MDVAKVVQKLTEEAIATGTAAERSYFWIAFTAFSNWSMAVQLMLTATLSDPEIWIWIKAIWDIRSACDEFCETMLLARAGLDGAVKESVDHISSTLVGKALKAVTEASGPKIRDFTHSLLDIILDLVTTEQAGVFLTTYFNTLNQFNSDLLNMVLAQCVAPVQMASAVSQVQTTMLWTLEATFPRLWGGVWAHSACAEDSLSVITLPGTSGS